MNYYAVILVVWFIITYLVELGTVATDAKIAKDAAIGKVLGSTARISTWIWLLYKAGGME